MSVLNLRFDLFDRLTVTELDLASRMLKEDIVGAVTQGTAGRWKGLALLAYMTAKHTDPTVKLAHYMALDATELITELNRLAGDEDLAGDLDAAEAELAALQAAQNDPDAELAGLTAPDPEEAPAQAVEDTANPTAPTPASSSPAPGAPTPTPSAV